MMYKSKYYRAWFERIAEEIGDAKTEDEFVYKNAVRYRVYNSKDGMIIDLIKGMAIKIGKERAGYKVDSRMVYFVEDGTNRVFDMVPYPGFVDSYGCMWLKEDNSDKAYSELSKFLDEKIISATEALQKAVLSKVQFTNRWKENVENDT